MNKPTLSILIPAYNEARTIATVIDRVCTVALPDGVARELIVLDDGSTDATADIARRAAARLADRHRADDAALAIRVHTSPVNRGKGSMFRVGLSLLTGDLALVQDADLELNPADIPALIAPLLAGEADVVYGSRFLHDANQFPLLTGGANRLLTAATNLLYGARLTDMMTGYKAFRPELVRPLDLRAERFTYAPELTARILGAGHPIHEVPVRYRPRTVAEGKKIRWLDLFRGLWTLVRCRVA
jgi:glycosyltransferase involved in cell wall biosynthesis